MHCVTVQNFACSKVEFCNIGRCENFIPPSTGRGKATSLRELPARQLAIVSPATSKEEERKICMCIVSEVLGSPRFLASQDSWSGFVALHKLSCYHTFWQSPDFCHCQDVEGACIYGAFLAISEFCHIQEYGGCQTFVVVVVMDHQGLHPHVAGQAVGVISAFLMYPVSLHNAIDAVQARDCESVAVVQVNNSANMLLSNRFAKNVAFTHHAANKLITEISVLGC